MCFNKCNHTYKYYDKRSNSHWYNGYEYEYIYYFVCLKCGKEIKIQQNHLISKLEKYKRFYNKNIILGKIKEKELSNISIPVMGWFCHSETDWGAHVTILKEFYKNKGIDITEIK
jgi:hypothetical protein